MTSARSILISSPSRKNGQILQREIFKLKRELRGVSVELGSVASATGDDLVAVVLSVPDWTAAESNVLGELRAGGYTGPVLVVADMAHENAERLDELFGPVRVLQSPVRKHDFRFAVREMLAHDAKAREELIAIRRAHERFDAEEMVLVEIAGKRIRHEARLVNISSGGACVELGRNVPVRIGDWARATIHLEELGKTHHIRARISWIEGRGQFQGPVLGLCFWRSRELLAL